MSILKAFGLFEIKTTPYLPYCTVKMVYNPSCMSQLLMQEQINNASLKLTPQETKWCPVVILCSVSYVYDPVN